MSRDIANYILRLMLGTQQIIPLRHEILRPGREVRTAHFDGDEDKDTFHFAAFQTEGSQTPICCVSFMKMDYKGEPAYRLRGMATAEEFQGKGVGKELAIFAENVIAPRTGIKLFWCDARVSAIPFYEKLGWKVDSEEFDVPDVGPHKKMFKIVS